MAEESQLSNGNSFSLGIIGNASPRRRATQRLSISDRTITKLRFRLHRVGSPGGIITFKIWAISGVYPGNVLASKLQGNANDISVDPTNYEVTLTNPIYLNQEVRIGVEGSAGDADGDYVLVRLESNNVGNGVASYEWLGAWVDSGGEDLYYVYTYDAGDTTALPTVTTQAVAIIANFTAMGNGNIIDIGGQPITQHGVCWSTSVNPTTADSHTSDGAVSTGAFISTITGLTHGTLYHVRAYATNLNGTSYGADVQFTTATGDETQGLIAVVGETLHWVGKSGVEYAYQGTRV